MRLATGQLRLLCLTCLALLAAGCTGSNLLDSGNSEFAVTLEVVGEDGTSIEYDCVNFLIDSLRVRPLDGVCADSASNPGEPCLNQTDCIGGPCEGSAAVAVTSGTGFAAVVAGENGASALRGNVLGTDCSPSKRCNGFLFGATCTDDSDCALGEDCRELNRYLGEPFIAPPSMTLTEGLYEVSEFRFELSMLRDMPPTELGCADGVTNFEQYYGDTLRFRMPPEGTKNLVFRLDLEELESNLATGNNCTGISGPVLQEVLECLTCDGAP